jgi:hypothetical protein
MANVPGQTAPRPVICAWLHCMSFGSKSAVLNVVIVLTSFPVLAYAGGPKAVVPILKIITGISVLIWSTTFAIFSLLTLPRIIRTPVSSMKRTDPPHRTNAAGVADHWLDGPI